jgi:hypothetical protein
VNQNSKPASAGFFTVFRDRIAPYANPSLYNNFERLFRRRNPCVQSIALPVPAVPEIAAH